MKVLQINNNHRIVGGSDTVYFNTGALLEENGVDVHYFAGKGDSDVASSDARFFPSAVDTKYARFKNVPQYLFNRSARRSISTMLAEIGKIDIAHLHIYYGRLTPSILGPLKRANVPILQSLHEYKLACPTYTFERGGKVCDACVSGTSLNSVKYKCKDGSLPKSMLLWLEYQVSRALGDIRHIDRFVCVSQFQRDILARAGVPEEKLVTLHNFVNPKDLKPRTFQNRQDYIFYFGRLETLKGIRTLLDAAVRSGRKLILAGDGALREEVENAARIHNNIEYLGFVQGEKLKVLVAAAAAVVVPSEWYENCPMSVLEAKAVGTPVIGARIGGIPELIVDGVDGFLFEAGSVEDLQSAMLKVGSIDHHSFSQNAIADVEARFAPSPHLQSLLDIYKMSR